MAKSIGLHQQDAVPTKQSKGEALERNYVFWALYVIDKMISTNLGIPCCLPSFDCNVELPKNDPTNPSLKHLVARIELACIQEDTYRSLYSSQAYRRGHVDRKGQIVRLDRELALWMSNNKKLCISGATRSNGSPSNESHANTALSYFYHSTRILVHRAGNESSDQHQCRENARACLQIFARLNRELVSIESAIVSRQIIRDHPLVPFFVLFANVIHDSPSEDSAQDLHLMLLATDVLQHLEHFVEDRSYIPQLLLVASSCCEAAGAIIRKSSILSSPHSTQSFSVNGTAPSSANNGGINGGIDPWAVDSRLWTSIVPGSPSLTAMVDPSEVPDNWSFDISRLCDLNGGGPTRAAGPGHTDGYGVPGSERTVFWGRAPGTTLY